MRLFFLLALMPMWAMAQPGVPELSVVFVRDVKGRPMGGEYAESFVAQQWTGTKRRPAFTVELHFTVSDDYPYGHYFIGRHQYWPLAPDTVEMGLRAHLRFNILDCWCVQQFLLVRQGEDMMHIDIPDLPAARWALKQRFKARSVEVASPEVVLFRPGRFSFEELAGDTTFHALEQRMADVLAGQ